MDIRQLLVALSAAASLGACATNKDIYTDRGDRAYRLACRDSVAARGWTNCYAAARDLCKEAGYEVLDHSDVINSGGGRSIFIACNRR